MNLAHDLQIEFALHAREHLAGMAWGKDGEPLRRAVADWLQTRMPEAGAELIERLARAHVLVESRSLRVDFDAIAAGLEQAQQLPPA